MSARRQVLAALAAVAALPVGAVALAVRPRWRLGLAERLGATPSTKPGAVWVHGASAGEALAAASLIRRLRDADLDVFASATTVAGREMLAASVPDVPRSLAPLDHPWCVDRALTRVRPAALVMVETELWPVWIAAARRGGAPVAVVSARLSARSLQRYRALGPLLRKVLAGIDAVGARTSADADRFRELGVPAERVSVTGDLKLDPVSALRPVAGDLASAVAGTACWIAGSTHSGEEAVVLDAAERLRSRGIESTLVVAPRNLERVDGIERMLRERGRSVRRRSALAKHAEPLERGEILLLDSLGELGGLYAMAAVSFVGGSLVEAGGHNLVEPALAGSVVLHGPHVENTAEAAALLGAAGAAIETADADALADAVARVLLAPESWSDAVERGQQALAAHRGAAAQSASLVASLLSGDAPSGEAL